jgi:hypothetical protein
MLLLVKWNSSCYITIMCGQLVGGRQVAEGCVRGVLLSIVTECWSRVSIDAMQHGHVVYAHHITKISCPAGW